MANNLPFEADVITGLTRLERIQVGFFARSVLINNVSGQWFFCPTIPAHIPPWVFNMVVQFPASTQVASFVADTPLGMTSTPLEGQIFRATFYEDMRPPSGFVLPPPVV